jgi:UV DNA damage endonuclease
MHPGQFTVLNTPEEQYFLNALKDLEYHNAVLTLMGLDMHHRIVLHGGGAYGNKARSVELLITRIGQLAEPIKARLALENDERVFNSEDILNICRQVKVPAILDIFHHEVLPGFPGRQLKDIILDFKTTWPGERQKVHYSNQEPSKMKGAHSDTIDVKAFGRFYETVKDLDLDIMLEVKDKQASVLKIKSAFPEIQ